MPHRITRRIKFLAVLSLCFAASARADDKSDQTKLVLESLAKRYEDLASWTATFTQAEKSPGFAQEIGSEGFFKFVRPNKFLLQTQNSNITKKFVSNGTEAIYLEDKGTTKKDRYFARKFASAKTLELERFLVFFRGLKSNQASQLDFEISGVIKKPDLEVTLVPKKESDFAQIKIIFRNADTFPKELIFVDAVGGETDLKIIQAANLKKFDPKWFDLTLPAGVKEEK